MTVSIEELLQDGFTEKFAKRYEKHIEDDKKLSCFDEEYLNWAHSLGFWGESAYAYGLTPDNADQYLTDYEYYKVFPLNEWNKIWVNDKLTLKYTLGDERFKKLLPKYYYYFGTNGIKRLMDNPFAQDGNAEATVDEVVELLKTVGEMACKPNNGAAGLGFYKLSADNGAFKINDNDSTATEVKELIAKSKNYLFTEFIHPIEVFKQIDPRIHTLRVVTINRNGNNPVIIGGYIRFAHNNDIGANYKVCDNGEDYNIFCSVDFEKGTFGSAKKIYLNKTETVEYHPDTNAPLFGELPCFEQIKKYALDLAGYYSSLEYLGFDIGITDDGPKLMEINTHPGIKYMQIFEPFKSNEYAWNYFKEKLASIDSLDEIGRVRRNALK